jgi:hypothetical protein
MLVELERRRLRKISTQLSPKPCDVIGEEHELMTGAGDGNVSEAGADQVRVDAGIGIDQDAFGSQTLRAMAGDGVTVIEVTMFNRIEVDFTVVI